MDPNTALELVKQGVTLLLLDVPQYTLLGIDTQTRKLKELLENNLGWVFQLNSAVDGIDFEEDDEFAPVVETLDDPSCN